MKRQFIFAGCLITLALAGCANTALQDDEARETARSLEECAQRVAQLREERRKADDIQQKLQAQLAERQRQLREEHRKVDELQEKVDALRAIDRDMRQKLHRR